MAVTKTITTAQPGELILCCRCKRARSELPVCVTCEGAYIRERVRTAPNVLDAVAKKIARGGK